MANDDRRYDSEPLICRACEARDAARAQFSRAVGEAGGTMHGIYFSAYEVADDPDYDEVNDDG